MKEELSTRLIKELRKTKDKYFKQHIEKGALASEVIADSLDGLTQILAGDLCLFIISEPEYIKKAEEISKIVKEELSEFITSLEKQQGEKNEQRNKYSVKASSQENKNLN